MIARRILLPGCICVLCVSVLAAATPSPTPTASKSPSPVASGSPATITQSFTNISAQSARMERSRIYHAGADYSRWLDQVAKDSGNAFLQRRVFENVTWVRLLAAGAALVFLSIFAGSFIWIVRKRAGEIESRKQQS